MAHLNSTDLRRLTAYLYEIENDLNDLRWIERIIQAIFDSDIQLVRIYNNSFLAALHC